MAKLEVGTKVIAKSDAPYGITTNGWKGEILDVKKDSVGHIESIKVKELPGQKSCTDWVEPKYFNVLDETRPATVFQVGMKVRANANAEGRYRVTKPGWVGIVVSVSTTDIKVKAEGSSKDGWWVDSACFDILFDDGIPATTETKPKKTKKKKDEEDIPKYGPDATKATLTNREVMELIFGFPVRINSCPSENCSDCPCADTCSSSSRWDRLPYVGRLTRPRDASKGVIHRIKTGRSEKLSTSAENKVLKTFCDKYNSKGDLEAIKYFYDGEYWENEQQYQNVYTLLLMNELIYVHNSETVSETAYRVLYLSFLASIGIGIDKNGYAFIVKKKGSDS